MSAAEETIAVRPRKRKRAAFACEACRIRKRRCDGALPVCHGCTKRRSTCVYSEEIEAREWHAGVIETLRARLTALEGAQSSTFQLPVSDDAFDLTATATTSEYFALPTEDFAGGDQSEGFQPTGVSSERVQRSSSHNRSSLSQANCIGVLPFSGEQERSASVDVGADQPRASTPSSHPSRLERLMRPIEEAVEQHATSDSAGQRGWLGAAFSLTKTSSARSDSNPCTCHIALDSGMWSLPMRRRADEMLDRYFTKPHRIFPLLHEPTFRRQYERLWIAWSGDRAAQQNATCVKLCRQKCQGRLFPATLNMVFALGCLHGTLTPAENLEQAEYFFRLAKEAGMMNGLHSQSQLEPIQLGTMLSTYLHTTERYTECWNMLGLTISSAQSLGLDLNQAEARRKGFIPPDATQVECELRKRLWGVCMVLKGEISSAFGRRSMIVGAIDTQLPDPIDDNLLSEDATKWNSQPANVPSWMGGVIEKLKLMRVVESNNAEDAALPQLAPGHAPNYKVILKQDTKLMRWHTGLPRHLQAPSSSPTVQQANDWSSTSAKRLQSWFLHFRLLGLRPALEYLFAKKHRQPLTPSPMTLESHVQELALLKISSQCASLAIDLIQLLEAEIAVLIAWSVNIDYLYTCGSTILMARCCSLKDSALSDESLREAWRLCLARLKQYAPISNVARNSLYLLEASARELLDPPSSRTERHASQGPNSSNTALSLPSTRPFGSRPYDAAALLGATREAAMEFAGEAEHVPTNDDIGIATLDILNGGFWDLPYWPSLSQLDQVPTVV